MADTEIWKPVVGFEGFYEISSFGRLKRIAPRLRGVKNSPKIIKLTLAPAGYHYVTLSRPGPIQKSISIHSIVAAAFIGPKPPGMEVNHKNGKRSDNRPNNLEYVTRSENHLHAYAKLGKKRASGAANGKATITDETVKKIRVLRIAGKTTRYITEATGASKSVIDHIVAGRSWGHVT